MERNTRSTNIIISNVLRIGSGVSVTLMITGLVLFLVQGHTVLSSPGTLHLSRIVRGAAALHPVDLMTLGIFTLISTPFLRVVSAAWVFLLIEKDKRYFLVSLGVLVILILSLLVPGVK